MENGDSANGGALARTLTREDSLYGDAFASPHKRRRRRLRLHRHRDWGGAPACSRKLFGVPVVIPRPRPRVFPSVESIETSDQKPKENLRSKYTSANPYCKVSPHFSVSL